MEKYTYESKEFVNDAAKYTLKIKKYFDALLMLEVFKDDIPDYSTQRKVLIEKISILLAEEAKFYEQLKDDTFLLLNSKRLVTDAFDEQKIMVQGNTGAIVDDNNTLCQARIGSILSDMQIKSGIIPASDSGLSSFLQEKGNIDVNLSRYMATQFQAERTYRTAYIITFILDKLRSLYPQKHVMFSKTMLTQLFVNNGAALLYFNNNGLDNLDAVNNYDNIFIGVNNDVKEGVIVSESFHNIAELIHFAAAMDFSDPAYQLTAQILAYATPLPSYMSQGIIDSIEQIPFYSEQVKEILLTELKRLGDYKKAINKSLSASLK